MMDTFGLAESATFWDVVKIFVIIGLMVYLVFAFVVMKQVNKMTDTLEVGFESQVRSIAWLHLLFALATLIVSIVVL